MYTVCLVLVFWMEDVVCVSLPCFFCMEDVLHVSCPCFLDPFPDHV